MTLTGWMKFKSVTWKEAAERANAFVPKESGKAKKRTDDKFLDDETFDTVWQEAEEQKDGRLLIMLYFIISFVLIE